MQMKLKGIYVARQLSFTGVSFRIEKVDSSNDFIQMYNESVNLVRDCNHNSLLVILVTLLLLL